MKNFLMTLLLLTGMSAHAKTVPCQKNCKEAVEAPVTEMVSVVRSAPNELKQDPSCPAPGYEVKKIAEAQGLIFSAKNIINDFLIQSQAPAALMNADQSHCGSSCKEINLVSTFTTSAPQQTLISKDCENLPIQVIQKELDNTEIENFANQTLRGQTDEGAALHHGCPKTCSLYVASSQTPVSPTRSLLNLTVRYGQPRDGAIFIADYKFKSGLIHQWTCTK